MLRFFLNFRLLFYMTFLPALIVGYYVYYNTLAKPLQYKEKKLEIPSGVGAAWLANYLHKQEIFPHYYTLRAYFWFLGDDLQVKAGQYHLLDVDGIAGLVKKVNKGEVIQYAITLIEGKTFEEYKTQLRSQRLLKDEILDMSQAQIMREVGAPGEHPEGQFAPQTYFYIKGMSDLDILRLAYKNQQNILKSTWDNKANTLRTLNSAYELLILASIIEKETGKPDERVLISGVFHNRLTKGMRLQTDPTVIYGIENFDGNIRRKDLQRDTPYNTYTRYGLTPTPIAMPGKASIEAAANPELTSALFFVAKGDGSHQFSTTLKQHNTAVKKYQLR